jgi:hypothetical protein
MVHPDKSQSKRYTPAISFTDHTTGTFIVQSESCDLVYYACNVLGHTCECPCGRNAFRNAKAGECKHIRCARAVYLSLEELRLAQLSAPLVRRPVAVAA